MPIRIEGGRKPGITADRKVSVGSGQCEGGVQNRSQSAYSSTA